MMISHLRIQLIGCVKVIIGTHIKNKKKHTIFFMVVAIIKLSYTTHQPQHVTWSPAPELHCCWASIYSLVQYSTHCLAFVCHLQYVHVYSFILVMWLYFTCEFNKRKKNFLQNVSIRRLSAFIYIKDIRYFYCHTWTCHQSRSHHFL